MLILNAEEVRQALPMRDAIQAMKEAYAALSDGTAQVPLRMHLAVAPHEALSLFMPAYVQAGGSEALAVKVVSLFPANPDRGLAYIQAAVLVLEADSGRPAALLEGGSLTAIRTGAGSGAAIDLLARTDSRTAAVFGAGVQARTQLEAACSVRDIRRVWVYDSARDKAEAFAREMAGRGPIPGEVIPAETPHQAAAEADILCTATTSKIPVFADEDLRPGSHICAIGAYTPEMQEVPAETIRRARVYVDSRRAALAEAGDLIQAMRSGLIDETHVLAELGEVVRGRRPGRATREEITFFKSVGVAVQDAMAAQLAVRNAREMGMGREVPFG